MSNATQRTVHMCVHTHASAARSIFELAVNSWSIGDELEVFAETFCFAEVGKQPKYSPTNCHMQADVWRHAHTVTHAGKQKTNQKKKKHSRQPVSRPIKAKLITAFQRCYSSVEVASPVDGVSA